jgi:hypothetical protein
MAIDFANNLYLANASGHGSDSLLIFNSAANGNVAPTTTIGGPNTTIDWLAGVALDSAGNIYVASANYSASPVVTRILEFSAGSTGNVVPIRTITVSSTSQGDPSGLRVDSQGNIYLLGAVSEILKFASNASGNASPASEIYGNYQIPGDYFGGNIALN